MSKRRKIFIFVSILLGLSVATGMVYIMVAFFRDFREQTNQNAVGDWGSVVLATPYLQTD